MDKTKYLNNNTCILRRYDTGTGVKAQTSSVIPELQNQDTRQLKNAGIPVVFAFGKKTAENGECLITKMDCGALCVCARRNVDNAFCCFCFRLFSFVLQMSKRLLSFARDAFALRPAGVIAAEAAITVCNKAQAPCVIVAEAAIPVRRLPLLLALKRVAFILPLFFLFSNISYSVVSYNGITTTLSDTL
ncbi:MAG: hypothetical protein LBH29_01345, partial [Elusimicrobiota bacterium]|nr:hypothetical protein [Elusimicrobiota bacterium]